MADRFNITRQRVDQILKKYGGVDATRAREVRAEKRAADFKRAIDGFLREYEKTIHALCDIGVTRAEIEQKFALLVPETPLEVIRAGVSATGALFDVAREDFHFSPLVVEASVWYVLGRLHGLHGDVDTALSELAADEMVAVSDALSADGVAPEAIRSVLFMVAAARRLITDDPQLTLTNLDHSR